MSLSLPNKWRGVGGNCVCKLGMGKSGLFDFYREGREVEIRDGRSDDVEGYPEEENN